MQNASDPLLFAWFVYLLGSSGCWRAPDGFDPKAILGHATRGPQEDGEQLLLRVRHESGPAIAVGPLDLDMLSPGWYPSTVEQGRRWLRFAAEALLEHASAAIGPALQPSGAPETLVLTREQINELGTKPVGDVDEPELTPAGLLGALKTSGTGVLSGKRLHWSIQAYASTEHTLIALRSRRGAPD